MSTPAYTREQARQASVAMCRAAISIRDGRAINGAVTHVIPEMLNAVADEGWHLHRDEDLEAALVEARTQAARNEREKIANWFLYEFAGVANGATIAATIGQLRSGGPE